MATRQLTPVFTRAENGACLKATLKDRGFFAHLEHACEPLMSCGPVISVKAVDSTETVEVIFAAGISEAEARATLRRVTYEV